MWHQHRDDSVLAKEANNLIKGERGRVAAGAGRRVQEHSYSQGRVSVPSGGDSRAAVAPPGHCLCPAPQS